MCGRYTFHTPGRLVADHFTLEEEPSLSPRYNIAPTQLVPVVREVSGSPKRKLDMLRWGLIPFWAEDLKIGNRLINARAETVSQKPAFRAAFKKRRCLVPADGFYEWERLDDKGKHPYLVALRDGGPFGFAGLWEQWKSPEGEVVESFTIITTEANRLVRDIHERMPVILHPADYDLWLDLSAQARDLVSLLRPFPSEDMQAYPVSSRVNSPKNDDPSFIERGGSTWRDT